MKVWILQTGEPLPIDYSGVRPMRAINLSTALVQRGHDVTLWSADFDHISKRHRFGDKNSIKISSQLEIRLIKSRGYKSHFGLTRLIDHAQLGLNLRKMLMDEGGPDVAFIGYPPIETAWVMARWLKRKGIPSVLDIKDAWPEIYLDSFPKVLRPPIKLLLKPYFLAMKSTFRSVTLLSSVTEPFLNWSTTVSGLKPNGDNFVNYLTTDPSIISDKEYRDGQDYLDTHEIYDTGVLRGSFIGTLNSVFDFEPIFAAAKILPIEIIIAGSGPLYSKLQETALELPNVKFLGWINAAQASALISRSTFMLAPYKNLSNFDIHIPNKFFDAMAHGVPVVTSIGGIAKTLVTVENIGFTYSEDQVDSLTDILSNILRDPSTLHEMSLNAKNLYNQRFSFEKVYGGCVSRLESLASIKGNFPKANDC